MAKKSGIDWKWVVGIATPILSAVVIYWLTEGFGRGGDTPEPPPQAQTYPWDGRVIDQTREQLLEGVEVSLDIQGVNIKPETFKDTTDGTGRYIFLIAKSVEPVIAVVNVAAQGYKPFNRKFTVESSGMLERQPEIRLVPAPVPIAAPPPSEPLPTARLGARAGTVLYLPRDLATATHVFAPLKINK